MSPDEIQDIVDRADRQRRRRRAINILLIWAVIACTLAGITLMVGGAQ